MVEINLTFNNEYLRLVETDAFKRRGATYIDMYWENRNSAEKHAEELRNYKYISNHHHDKSQLEISLIPTEIFLSKSAIKLLLNETFQLFLEDLQGRENNNQTWEILTTKFIDACIELKQAGFLTKEIYLEFLESADMFSSCGDSVRKAINKEFLENICKKLFD